MSLPSNPSRKRLGTAGVSLAASTATVGESTLRCADCPEVQVVRIIDGDTLDTSRGRVRLFDVRSPERGERCATEATERLRQLAGDTVLLEDGPRLTDTYGRTLAYVFTLDGISIDAALIREGFATAWTRDGQHRDRLVGWSGGQRGRVLDILSRLNYGCGHFRSRTLT